MSPIEYKKTLKKTTIYRTLTTFAFNRSIILAFGWSKTLWYDDDIKNATFFNISMKPTKEGKMQYRLFVWRAALVLAI